MADYLGRIALEFRDIVQAGEAGAEKDSVLFLFLFSRKLFELECPYKSLTSDLVSLG